MSDDQALFNLRVLKNNLSQYLKISCTIVTTCRSVAEQAQENWWENWGKNAGI